MHHAGLLIFAVIFLTFLFGSAHLLVNQIIFPSEFEKLINRKPFKSFIQKGFFVCNGYLKGNVHDYEVLLGYFMDENKFCRKLHANIVFKPERNGKFLTETEIESINKKYAHHDFFSWSYNSLDVEWEFDGLPPNFDEIWDNIKDGISILKEEQLQPSTLADSYNVEKEIWDALLDTAQ